MAVNWYRVKSKLKPYCPEGTESLYDILVHLYKIKSWSLTKILSLTDREILCLTTLSNKLRECNIEVRTRGGDNVSKTIPLTLNDFQEYSARELAQKHDVHVTTIYNRKHKIEGEKNEKNESNNR